MPIIKTGRNSFEFNYKLPKRKKNLMTKEFLQTFKQELDNVFNKEDDYQSLEKRNYWNTYQYMEGTCGFYEALKLTCEKYDLTKAIYKYACKMPYYDSDWFDSEVTLLMVKLDVIKEGNINETCDDTDYEDNDDFELIVTEEKLKDCTVIHTDWVLTKECKERLGIKELR